MFSLKTSNYTYQAYLELTSRCNLRCVYCALSQPDYHGQDFDAAKFDDVVRDLKKRRTSFFMMNGHGETTIVKDWHLLCNKLHDEGFRLMMTTNLSKPLKDHEIETLTRFHMISTSCDTIDPDLFSKIRRHSKLETVYENMERIQRASKKKGRQPIWAWNAVVSDVSVWGLEAWAHEGLKRGIQNFNLFTLGNYSPLPDIFQARPLRFLSDQDCLRVKEIIDKTKAIIRKGGGYVYVESSIIESITRKKNMERKNQQNLPLEYEKTEAEPMTRDCFDPWLTAFLKSDGSVAPCCAHEPIAKIDHQNSLQDVLKNGAFQSFRQKLIDGNLSPRCVTCTRRAKIPVQKFRWKLKIYKLGAFFWLHFLWIFRHQSTRKFAKLAQRLFISLQKV